MLTSFELKAYGQSNSAIEAYDVPVVKMVTFSDFLNLIKEKPRLDRYRHCPEGHGCFHWHKILLHRMRSERWLEEKIADDVLEKLDNHKQGEIIGKYIIPGCEGTFF